MGLIGTPRARGHRFDRLTIERKLQKMGESDRDVDTLWRIHEAVSAHVRYADTKAAVVLAAGSVLVTVALPPLLERLPDLRWWTLILAAIGVALLVGSAGSAITCLMPRKKPDRRGEAPPSLLFFEHVTRDHRTAHDYVDAVERELSDPATLRRQVAEQIWSNAKVASTKFAHVDRALALLLVAIGVAVVVTIITYIGTNA